MMHVEHDGKFTIGYVTSDGESSYFRCLPEAARLFAASPKLLKACKAIEKAMDGLTLEGEIALAVKEVHDAIEEAEME
ncbi:MAG TPA: hypothetical protein V6C65_03770 [Allocoleopsis sp.]